MDKKYLIIVFGVVSIIQTIVFLGGSLDNYEKQTTRESTASAIIYSQKTPIDPPTYEEKYTSTLGIIENQIANKLYKYDNNLVQKGWFRKFLCGLMGGQMWYQDTVNGTTVQMCVRVTDVDIKQLILTEESILFNYNDPEHHLDNIETFDYLNTLTPLPHKQIREAYKEISSIFSRNKTPLETKWLMRTLCKLFGGTYIETTSVYPPNTDINSWDATGEQEIVVKSSACTWVSK